MHHAAADQQDDTEIIKEGNNRDSYNRDNNNDESNPSLIKEKVMVDYYPIKNHRRMRSKVLHYIDHPLVGILVQINPVKKQMISKQLDGSSLIRK